MDGLIPFIEKVLRQEAMHVSIGYSKITDWTVHIYKQGCGKNGKDLKICYVQDPDAEYALSKAKVLLMEWLSENRGGY